MEELAGEQPCDGLQPDVRVRADVGPASVTVAGPMWSTKHQAPTVRRVPAGQRPPDRERPLPALSRLSVISMSHAVGRGRRALGRHVCRRHRPTHEHSSSPTVDGSALAGPR